MQAMTGTEELQCLSSWAGESWNKQVCAYIQEGCLHHGFQQLVNGQRSVLLLTGCSSIRTQLQTKTNAYFGFTYKDCNPPGQAL